MHNYQDLETGLALLDTFLIHKVWYQDRWFYAVAELIEILTESENPEKSWNLVRKRLIREGARQTCDKIVQLPITLTDGKNCIVDCADTKTLLRIIQSIPSPRAEPFKQWLAEVGAQRMEEIENPELAMERMKALYHATGYPEEWIDARVRGITVRQELTEAWQERGAEEGIEYAILTNEIAAATFGVDVAAHKQVKTLRDRDNLRDHMTSLELILTSLGEATAKAIHESRDSQGFDALSVDALDAGSIAGRARRDIEEKTRQPVVSPENFLHLTGGQRQVIADADDAQPRLFAESNDET